MPKRDHHDEDVDYNVDSSDSDSGKVQSTLGKPTNGPTPPNGSHGEAICHIRYIAVTSN